ncbi:MAG: phytoene desaturase [Luteibaculaceae bacterium]|jgi:phytoene desaturase
MAELIVVGGGVAGISSACYAAKRGKSVVLLDNHDQIGGRVRSFTKEGFTFDMGPSWYWMPDVFADFFSDHGFNVEDLLDLKRLDPSYSVFWDDESWDIPANMQDLLRFFEKQETGAGEKLKIFLADAKEKYDISMGQFIKKPALSPFEFVNIESLKFLLSGKLLGALSKEIEAAFKNPKLRKLLEFPVLFLGSTAQNIPQMYSLMNHADMTLGTWYPMGGMVSIIEAMKKVLDHYGVQVICNTEVTGLEEKDGKVTSLITSKGNMECDHLIWTADYHHFDTVVAPPKHRMYSKKYWESRVLAPSAILFYVGVNRQVEGLQHHNLFFDTDFDAHTDSIYKDHGWPEDPLFYICAPSKTDSNVAPQSMENLFILIPIATNLERDNQRIHNFYNKILTRLEKKGITGIRGNEIIQEHFFVDDFKKEYNSLGGNAYGLANTLKQTAFLKPKMKSRSLGNVVFAGQMTNPGPGLPPSIISGEIAASLL